MPFSPKGDQAQRTIVAQAASKAEYGQLLTFGELAAHLNIDPVRSKGQIRQAVASARPLLLRDSLRALVSVRGKGYRVARPGEQAGMAQGHRHKADIQMLKALDLVNFVDEGKMSSEELARHRAVAIVLTNIHQRMVGAESRLETLEDAVDSLKSAVFGNGPPLLQGHVEQS